MVITGNRAEHAFDIPLGAVVHDKDGGAWVYIGTLATTVGLSLYFVKEHKAVRMGSRPWTYMVTMTDSVLRKFPGVDRFLKVER